MSISHKPKKVTVMIKKALLTLLLLVSAALSPQFASAQLRYGIVVGGSIPKASLDNAPGYSMRNRSGFAGGLDLEYQMPACGLAFDGSLLYQRYSTTIADDATGTQCNLGRNFIEVPLSVKYKFWLPVTNNLAAPMLFTGPSFMLNVDSKHNALAKQERFHFGWNVGAGLDVANIIQLSAGYRFGIGNSLRRFEAAPEADLDYSGWFVTAKLLFDF